MFRPLRQATDGTTFHRVSMAVRATLAAAFVCSIAVPAGALSVSSAHAAGTCATTNPTKDAQASADADFTSDASITSNFNAARLAEGCATTFTLPGNFDSLSAQQKILVLFNTERTDRGLSPLKLDNTLISQISLNHSRERAQYGYQEHTSPINHPGNVFGRLTVNPAIQQAKVSLSEDIAWYGVPALDVYAYMYADSSSAWGHRQAILGNYDWVGIGVDPVAGTDTDDFLLDSPSNPYTPPATANTSSPSLNPPTLSGTTATVTNVAENGDAAAITGVVFYTGSIVDTGGSFNTVSAASQGNGTWTATLPAGSTGTLHAVAVDASGNYTDVAAAGATTGSTGGTRSTAAGGATSACTSDNTCLTGIKASGETAAAGSSVTVTATTNVDVAPTVWYVDIVDENGAIIKGCGSGTSCAATVSSTGAATHRYTAQLSTSSSSIAGSGPKSSLVTVTWSAATGGTNTGGTTSACTSDNTCLTGIKASGETPAAGSSVTVTATTNVDVAPTVWYVDIVDENGAIIKGCGSGTSCAATVSSTGAATHRYTAQLSTSSSSIAGSGPKSSSVTVTWH